MQLSFCFAKEYGKRLSLTVCEDSFIEKMSKRIINIIQNVSSGEACPRNWLQISLVLRWNINDKISVILITKLVYSAD